MHKKKNTTNDAGAALSKAQFICSKQEKCRSDIRKKLQEWDVPPNKQDDIIQSLVEGRFIDETRYTRAYVRDKLHFNKWGRIKIAYHLVQKQIPQPIIDNELCKIDQNEYVQLLAKLLEDKMKNSAENDSFRLKAKLYRFAQGRGFEPQIALSLLDQMFSKTN